MKRSIALLLAAILCLCLAAWGKAPESEHSPQESHTKSTDPDVPAMGVPSKIYVDRQGTDKVYSSLSITQGNTGYVVEMEIYRLGYFRGTAVEADGMLVYTDDLTDIKGTIRYDADHADFEVTESAFGLAEAGTTWMFPEPQEGF